MESVILANFRGVAISANFTGLVERGRGGEPAEVEHAVPAGIEQIAVEPIGIDGLALEPEVQESETA